MSAKIGAADGENVDALTSETATPAAKEKISGERSLLIVEDDKSFLQRLAKALEQRGFAVTTAESVADGLLQVEKVGARLSRWSTCGSATATAST